MIDVIIPAYNAHETIIRTLASIAMQLNRKEVQVTIVNDGGRDYHELINTFSNLLNIKEISYEENKGPGYARQFGLDNTKGDYITFIDADDTFMDALSLINLSKPLKDTDAKMVVSPFAEISKDNQYHVIQPNFVWVFGKMYRRTFLDEHKIRFTDSRANEDVGFNKICSLLAPNKITAINMITYLWHFNQASITRRGQSEYEFGICTPGFIYNLHNAYDVALKEGVNMELLAENMLETAFSCYIYYNIALAKNIPYAKEIEQLSRKYYLAYYKKCLPYISDEKYKIIYTQSYNSKAIHTMGIIFKITLDDFIQLMLDESKKDDIIDYKETEIRILKEIQEKGDL